MRENNDELAAAHRRIQRLEKQLREKDEEIARLKVLQWAEPRNERKKPIIPMRTVVLAIVALALFAYLSLRR